MLCYALISEDSLNALSRAMPVLMTVGEPTMIDFFLSPNVQSSTPKDFEHIRWLRIKMCNISPLKQDWVALNA